MKPSRIAAIVIAALVVTVLAATNGVSRADQPLLMEQQPKWEYKVEHCGYHSGLVAELNKIGAEGWELVQIADGIGVFKRRKTVKGDTTRSDVQIELLDAPDFGVKVLRGKEKEAKRVTELIRQIEQRPAKSTPTVMDEEHVAEAQSAPTDSSLVPTGFDKMEKKDLKQELVRLQKEVLDAVRISRRARGKAAEAASAYKSASDDEKAEALFRMIEADAASREPAERYAHLRTDFDAAKRAYLNLLILDSES